MALCADPSEGSPARCAMARHSRAGNWPGALGRMRTRLTGHDAWCLARSIYVASDKIMERLVRGARHDFLEGLP